MHMIDIRKLKELVKLMVENELSELDLRDQSETVTIKRGSDQEPIIYQAPAQAAAAPAAPAAAAAPAPAEATADASDAGLVPIESPMVGTYYSKPNPDSPTFANIGDQVGPDSVVCLLEAMKVFNEIKAEQSGTIAKCLVNDGDAVEFGQTLFMVKPN
jgi:acetyl-CoA carboxylase biotin carboxyl carrier protein|tara:strand:+ start:1285 stop:1758 length:474 start_codon:yes stop_codon:yes gene_type:complete